MPSFGLQKKKRSYKMKFKKNYQYINVTKIQEVLFQEGYFSAQKRNKNKINKKKTMKFPIPTKPCADPPFTLYIGDDMFDYFVHSQIDMINLTSLNLVHFQCYHQHQFCYWASLFVWCIGVSAWCIGVVIDNNVTR